MSIRELQEYTRVGKYARYNKEKQRRETWTEQVDRVMDMHKERYKDIFESIEEEWTFAREMLLKKRVLGSQRALQFGGPAILQKNARLYNCFSPETEFISSAGVTSFSDHEDGDILEVLSHEGVWRSAVVRNYGRDKLNKIGLKKGKSHVSYQYATSDHTWILKDGTRTENLKVGDQLLRSPSIFKEFDWDSADPMERLYWCYGLVFGDGTRVKDKDGNHAYSMIRLCGDDKEYSNRFEQMGFKTSTGTSIGGDFMAYTGTYLKELPDPAVDSPNLIRAFVRGLLDADGGKNSNYAKKGVGSVFVNIQQSDSETRDFIRKIFPVAGVYITSEEKISRSTNFGKHDAVRFNIYDSMDGSSPIWVVDSIEENAREDEVWCLEVAEDKSFIMPNGIVTGNCAFTYVDRARMFAEFMHMCLCGVGVGFSVQTHHIDLLPKIGKRENGKKLFVIPDTIEGWADAVDALVRSYFKVQGHPHEYYGYEVEFDYSEIRPAGAIIKSSGSKAPGPEGLKRSLEMAQTVLENILLDGRDRLKAIDAYDILMHLSDAVVSGGVRRAATLCLFSPSDTDMVQAKTGNWMDSNPQRARSNNSALLVRGQTTKEEFSDLMESVKQFGEPGFIWSDDTESGYNPCVEIGLYAKHEETGESGWQVCNLCEINMKKARSTEEFYNACRAGAILGTLQAGYTDFEYLGKVSEDIIRREALIGVSMTGMMDTPDIAFDPEIQKEGARLIKKVNAEMAKKIGINPAARSTCVKPAGTTSAILGTSSGIHPHHAKRYFRRVQANQLEGPLGFFKMYNPLAVEKSVWDPNGVTDVITFVCEVPDGAKTKNQVNALDLLESVKLTQQNWVTEGTRKSAQVKPWVRHNVSNTIHIMPSEWDEVTEYIYKNRQFFAGISLIPVSGDKDYPQAPFTSVYTPKEMEREYGDGVMFASGLIVHAHKAFDRDLWAACSCALGSGETITVPALRAEITNAHERAVTRQIEHWREQGLSPESPDSLLLAWLKHNVKNYGDKIRWVSRFKKFAKNYFEGDETKTSYCIKDVNNWKLWCDLSREYQDVPWEDFSEVEDNTKLEETVACAGGACEVTLDV